MFYYLQRHNYLALFYNSLEVGCIAWNGSAWVPYGDTSKGAPDDRDS